VGINIQCSSAMLHATKTQLTTPLWFLTFEPVSD